MPDFVSFIAGLIVGAIIIIGLASSAHKDICVDKGYAEFYINEDGDKDFRYFTIEELMNHDKG